MTGSTLLHYRSRRIYALRCSADCRADGRPACLSPNYLLDTARCGHGGMAALDFAEPVVRRALDDTAKAFHTIRFWAYEVSVGVILALWAQFWQPAWADKGAAMIWYQGLVPFAGLAAGMALLLLIHLVFLSPYRQRNEARSAALGYAQRIEELIAESPRRELRRHIAKAMVDLRLLQATLVNRVTPRRQPKI